VHLTGICAKLETPFEPGGWTIDGHCWGGVLLAYLLRDCLDRSLSRIARGRQPFFLRREHDGKILADAQDGCLEVWRVDRDVYVRVTGRNSCGRSTLQAAWTLAHMGCGQLSVDLTGTRSRVVRDGRDSLLVVSRAILRGVSIVRHGACAGARWLY
jgi:hypothetical protein